VIESVDELPGALARANDLQPKFEQTQRAMSAASIDQAEVPASERQATAILTFAKRQRAVPAKSFGWQAALNGILRPRKLA
jgi:hypothetical protein